MFKPHPSLLLLALLALVPPAIAATPEVPAELRPAISSAERLGKALADATPAANCANKAALDQARKQGAELCDFQYKLVSVKDGTADASYLIGTSSRKTDIVVGRHFMLSGERARPSSNTCFNVKMERGPDGELPVAFTVTHLLSPAPSEFHVYLSLVQAVPLVVLADGGTWLVSAGRIHLMGPPPGSASPDPPSGLDAKRAEAFEAAIAPYVAKARQSWPAAKNRYLAGLPAGDRLFVTTRLRDSLGRFEQVFIRVTGIDGEKIAGQIANDLNLVTGFRRGQAHAFAESDLLDWTVVKPDGTEEGNVVGKFLDTYRP